MKLMAYNQYNLNLKEDFETKYVLTDLIFILSGPNNFLSQEAKTFFFPLQLFFCYACIYTLGILAHRTGDCTTNHNRCTNVQWMESEQSYM